MRNPTRSVALRRPLCARRSLFLDTFSDLEDTPLASHTPDKGSYATVDPDLLIKSNALNQGNYASNSAFFDLPATNVILSANVTTATSTGNHNKLIVFTRFVDWTHYWQTTIGKSISPAIAIYEANGGAAVLRASRAIPWTAGMPFFARVFHKGASLSVLAVIDGTPYTLGYGFAGAHTGETTHGVGLYNNTAPANLSLDYLKVRAAS